ncbi:MAG: tetratricopeptide repeat protein [Candidatus Eremiobacteraeota bacterium]|nr:tetratricopeptide repeat protein [Candidatus Eremiobacteraeota bacterium]
MVNGNSDDKSPVAHATRAAALAGRGELDGAIAEANRALELEPDFSYAHLLLAKLLSERALAHLQAVQKPFDSVITKYTGDGEPIRVLQLGSTRAVGQTNTEAMLDPATFETTTIVVQYWDPQRALPPHHVVFNAIADPDSCAGALDVANWLLQKTAAPLINPPARVLATGRVTNAERLRNVDAVIAPASALMSRAFILANGNGFNYPLLVRSPGYHNGEHLAFVDEASRLFEAVNTLPGDDLLAIEFVDTRSADGRFRKYRAMAIDGELYPAHMAVSNHWNVHYFSAQMGAAERAEEARYLDDMRDALGNVAFEALLRLAAAVGLDYLGIDFGIAPDGRVVVFEANAAMTIFMPEASPETEYRRRAAARIFEAGRELVKRRAGR